MDKLRIDHARATIDTLMARYGKGKTKLTDDQIAEGLERYRPKAEVDLVVVDELNATLGDGGYRQAAEYWQRMYEETFAERTCEIVERYEARDRHEIGNNRVRFSCGHFGTYHFKFCAECGAKVVNKWTIKSTT